MGAILGNKSFVVLSSPAHSARVFSQHFARSLAMLDDTLLTAPLIIHQQATDYSK